MPQAVLYSSSAFGREVVKITGVGTHTYYVPVGEDAPAGTPGYVEQGRPRRLAAVQRAGFPIQWNPVIGAA